MSNNSDITTDMEIYEHKLNKVQKSYYVRHNTYRAVVIDDVEITVDNNLIIIMHPYVRVNYKRIAEESNLSIDMVKAYYTKDKEIPTKVEKLIEQTPSYVPYEIFRDYQNNKEEIRQYIEGL